MTTYINISLDLTICQRGIIDLRVPKVLTIKELLMIVNDAYH